MKTKVFKSIIICLSILLSIVVSELLISSFSTAANIEFKLWSEQTTDGYANYYSSNRSGYFPITKYDEDLDKTLYGVYHDIKKREKGMFPEREKGAAIIGDSFAFGEGLKDEDNIANLLSENLDNINFRNFGQPGIYIGEIKRILKQLLDRKANIKSIIYVYNLNDRYPEAPPQGFNDLQNIRWDRASFKNNIIRKYLFKSTLFKIFEKKMKLRKETKRAIRSYNNSYFNAPSYLEHTISDMLLMNQLCINKGVNFQIIIYPLMYKNNFGKYPFEKIHQLIKTQCEKFDISCIDVYPVFEKFYSLKKFIVHPIDYHPNSKANKLVVEYLVNNAQFLENLDYN